MRTSAERARVERAAANETPQASSQDHWTWIDAPVVRQLMCGASMMVGLVPAPCHRVASPRYVTWAQNDAEALAADWHVVGDDLWRGFLDVLGTLSPEEKIALGEELVRAAEAAHQQLSNSVATEGHQLSFFRAGWHDDSE